MADTQVSKTCEGDLMRVRLSPRPQGGKKMKTKVLIIEDHEGLQKSYKRALKEKVEIIQAFTINEAEKLLIANPDIGLISLDACVPGNKINTLPLLKKIKEVFHGPIIAASSDPQFNAELIKNGCTHKCEDKFELPQTIIKILEKP